MPKRYNPGALLVLLASSCAAEHAHDGQAPPPANDTLDAGSRFDVGALDGDPSGGFDAKPTKKLDPGKDNDGDGWVLEEDCDDADVLTNPGAYDIVGNGRDDDCDGKIDAVDACDDGSILEGTKDARDLARAFGLCRFTTDDAKGKARTWGVLDASIVHADGSPGVDPMQHAVLTTFGPNVSPHEGKSLVALSTGTARLPSEPGFVVPREPSYVTKSEVTPPEGWPKNTPGCDDPSVTTANDSVGLKLRLRVPTNAKALTFELDFYSSEYVSWVCSEYNDTFVALLDGKSPLDPKWHRNVSFDAKGNAINVNSGFFEVCTPAVVDTKTFPCAKGTKELLGTGFWDPLDVKQNGATSWLRTRAPVVAGETITIQFVIWDTGGQLDASDTPIADHILDSTVLLDDFGWDAADGPSTPSTDRPR